MQAAGGIGLVAVTRREVMALMLAGVAGPVLAEAPATSLLPRRRGEGRRVAARVEAPGRLVAEAALGGAVGYVVADAATGRVLEGEAADLALPPGSVAKAITALYALERLGPGHRFATRVLATGPVVGGKVEGDLILAGGGDPTLQTDHLGDVAARLAGLGLRGVTGRLLYHEAALPSLDLIDAGQPEHVGYNPALSGLNLNFNRVNFEWKRAPDGYAVQMDARGERFLPLVGMATVEVVAREAPLFTFEKGPGRERWTVARAALGKGGSRWLPVRHPGLYAAEVFRTLARAQGIELPAPQAAAALPQGTTLAEHLSDDLARVLRDMLKFSTNLTAEVVGLSASGAATLAESGKRMTDWARERLGISALFVDHSGLGGASRIAAADMVRALVAGSATPSGAGLRGILREVGMRDDAGKDIKDHPVKVVAKSGTLNFASGLAGFIRPPGGRELVFAIFCADVERRDRIPPEQREEPEGGDAWIRRARRLQGRLIARWASLYT